MRSTVALVREMVAQLDPVDELESEHRRQVLRWLDRTDDVFRRAKPAEPAQHLVSYVVPVDAADDSIEVPPLSRSGCYLPPVGSGATIAALVRCQAFSYSSGLR
ncbi:hypothetical protein Vau01_096120 [Virgisporangium aurantiacum]|uniref:Uncharacterized protein n=1 Tax=Virgisporangium aurantiacum TaxID=175570 RepID=A0A8J4E5B6_9ACTN|nr:hypothetical protein Vau01_096120 [Virgisporangium aurantiacum]